MSKKLNADSIEIHTGKFCRIINRKKGAREQYNQILKCSKAATLLGLKVHAGHGITYKSALLLSKNKYIDEFNIGHFIIGESIFTGLKKVINNFKKILKK